MIEAKIKTTTGIFGTRQKGMPVWECTKCNKRYRTKGMAIAHIKKEHMGVEEDGNKR